MKSWNHQTVSKRRCAVCELPSARGIQRHLAWYSATRMVGAPQKGSKYGYELPWACGIQHAIALQLFSGPQQWQQRHPWCVLLSASMCMWAASPTDMVH
jgi:hypothetical protein